MTTTPSSPPSKLDSVYIDAKNGDLVKKTKIDEKTSVSKIIDNNFIRSGTGSEYAPGMFIIREIYTKGQEAVKICDLKPTTDMCCYIKLKVLIINLTDMSSYQLITHKYHIKVINSKVVIQRISSKVDFTDGLMASGGINVYVNGDAITFAAVGAEGNVLKWDVRLTQIQNNFTFEPNFPQAAAPKTLEDATHTDKEDGIPVVDI